MWMPRLHVINDGIMAISCSARGTTITSRCPASATDGTVTGIAVTLLGRPGAAAGYARVYQCNRCNHNSPATSSATAYCRRIFSWGSIGGGGGSDGNAGVLHGDGLVSLPCGNRDHDGDGYANDDVRDEGQPRTNDLLAPLHTPVVACLEHAYAEAFPRMPAPPLPSPRYGASQAQQPAAGLPNSMPVTATSPSSLITWMDSSVEGEMTSLRPIIGALPAHLQSAFSDAELLEMRRAFTQMDGDRCGTLEGEEVQAALVVMGHRDVTLPQVETLIAIVDDNGNGSLEFEEYVALIHMARSGGLRRAVQAQIKEAAARRKEDARQQQVKVAVAADAEQPLIETVNVLDRVAAGSTSNSDDADAQALLQLAEAFASTAPAGNEVSGPLIKALDARCATLRLADACLEARRVFTEECTPGRDGLDLDGLGKACARLGLGHTDAQLLVVFRRLGRWRKEVVTSVWRRPGEADIDNDEEDGDQHSGVNTRRVDVFPFLDYICDRLGRPRADTHSADEAGSAPSHPVAPISSGLDLLASTRDVLSSAVLRLRHRPPSRVTLQMCARFEAAFRSACVEMSLGASDGHDDGDGDVSTRYASDGIALGSALDVRLAVIGSQSMVIGLDRLRQDEEERRRKGVKRINVNQGDSARVPTRAETDDGDGADGGEAVAVEFAAAGGAPQSIEASDDVDGSDDAADDDDGAASSVLSSLAGRANTIATLAMRPVLIPGLRAGKLDLSSCGLRDTHMRALALALYAVPIFSSINLRGNRITDVGVQPLLDLVDAQRRQGAGIEGAGGVGSVAVAGDDFMEDEEGHDVVPSEGQSFDRHVDDAKVEDAAAAAAFAAGGGIREAGTESCAPPLPPMSPPAVSYPSQSRPGAAALTGVHRRAVSWASILNGEGLTDSGDGSGGATGKLGVQPTALQVAGGAAEVTAGAVGGGDGHRGRRLTSLLAGKVRQRQAAEAGQAARDSGYMPQWLVHTDVEQTSEALAAQAGRYRGEDARTRALMARIAARDDGVVRRLQKKGRQGVSLGSDVGLAAGAPAAPSPRLGMEGDVSKSQHAQPETPTTLAAKNHAFGGCRDTADVKGIAGGAGIDSADAGEDGGDTDSQHYGVIAWMSMAVTALVMATTPLAIP